MIKNIYCDMDGVLADFNREINGVERFKTEEKFFLNLKPIKHNVKALNKIINEKRCNVYILSASPNEKCDNDKKEWLQKYVPTLKKENIIIIRNGQNKADYVKTLENNLLFDDWGKNIEDFTKRGYSAYKIELGQTILKGYKKLC